MPSQSHPDSLIALVQQTLDLLLLDILVFGPCHGQGIARSIQCRSERVFSVDHGSLFPSHQRPEEKKWISAKQDGSEINRKACFYSLAPKGRARLVERTREQQHLTRAMGLILTTNQVRAPRRLEDVKI